MAAILASNRRRHWLGDAEEPGDRGGAVVPIHGGEVGEALVVPTEN